MIPLLPPHTPFPDPRPAIDDYDGLVCVTEDLTPDRLLMAYPHGIFPWHYDGMYFYWFTIAPRAVLLPEQLHISRSLKKAMQTQTYRITVNHAFADVIHACAETTRAHQNGTWIAPEFQTAYTEMHQLGHAHSFEYWDAEQRLMGGLYGVQIGKVFFGESMFSRQSNASKIAFAHAVPFLAQCGVQLIDCQQDTPHLAQFGSQTWAFDDFEAELTRLTALPLNQTITPQVIGKHHD